MDAPEPRLDEAQFLGVIVEHIRIRYDLTPETTLLCKECGATVEQVVGTLSVHDRIFGDACVGQGQTIPIKLPFCPTCEGPPKRTATCIHIGPEPTLLLSLYGL